MTRSHLRVAAITVSVAVSCAAPHPPTATAKWPSADEPVLSLRVTQPFTYDWAQRVVAYRSGLVISRVETARFRCGMIPPAEREALWGGSRIDELARLASLKYDEDDPIPGLVAPGTYLVTNCTDEPFYQLSWNDPVGGPRELAVDGDVHVTANRARTPPALLSTIDRLLKEPDHAEPCDPAETVLVLVKSGGSTGATRWPNAWPSPTDPGPEASALTVRLPGAELEPAASWAEAAGSEGKTSSFFGATWVAWVSAVLPGDTPHTDRRVWRAEHGQYPFGDR